ncbi:MAG TPA: serine/threonine-protein kinase [Solirubrobacteraceae bacterium]|jgi:serine/threonine-protein kinase|nr:serine/threonine-protein kinase [Solirubrobacteraceae bacterium]
MAITAFAGGSPLDRVALPDRYVILSHVANGGMSSVWCARDELLDRTVAIKLLAEAYAQDEVAVRRFEREARAAARVSGHPNVATVYDIGVAPPADGAGADSGGIGAPFIVMEYLAGGSVAGALQRARGEGLDPEFVARCLQDAAAALDYAHSLDVVHRDVKPGNLLLDDSDRVRVADFGIARLMSEATITNIGEVLGTAAYLSPEQARGEPTTPASDRYSLAVTAYEMLTGTRPFEAEAVLAQRGSGRTEELIRASARNPALPKAVDPVLAHGLADAPERRFASAAEFAGALERVLSKPTQAPAQLRFADEPAAYAPFVSSGARRRGPAAWTGALALVAVIALGAGIATGSDSSSSSATHRSRAAASARTHRAVARTTLAAVAPPRPHSTSKPATSTAKQTTSTSTAATPPTPLALDTQGHEMMLQGDYTGAISTMREVLAATPADSLLHAYALFDLGRSLRLAGDPQAAIPILEQRLQYPNQTAVVQVELKLAERAAGLTPPAGGPGNGHRHGPHSGGAAPGGPGGHGQGNGGD